MSMEVETKRKCDCATHLCLGCEKTCVATSHTNDTPVLDDNNVEVAVPSMTMTACHGCGFWVKIEDGAPFQLHFWRVGGLPAWCAYFAGLFAARVQRQQEEKRVTEMVMRGLAGAFGGEAEPTPKPEKSS